MSREYQTDYIEWLQSTDQEALFNGFLRENQLEGDFANYCMEEYEHYKRGNE